MPELRRDPVFGYWTIISTERSRRPMEFSSRAVPSGSECDFCAGHEKSTTPEILAVRPRGGAPDTPGWDVRVFSSKIPILSLDRPADRYGEGMYDLMEGVGKHEIVVECPHHCHDLDEMEPEQIEKAVQVYIRRINELEKDPRFQYVLLFKNHGLITGSAKDVVRHSRSQIIALPILPKRVREELTGARAYFDRRERCVFCDILRQETHDRSRLVCENDDFITFCPFASRSPFEMWIMPKRHSPDFGKLEQTLSFSRILKESLTRLRSTLDDPPYNSILHTAPYRHKRQEIHWQTIQEDYHWYFQISPRLTQSAGFEWGTGIHINPTPPEDAAQLLRESRVHAGAA